MNRAKKLTLGVHTDFSEIHDKINKQPNNIEELTDIQNFIANVPGNLRKIYRFDVYFKMKIGICLGF